MLLSQAVERASKGLLEQENTRLGYFYCSYNNSASQQLRNILGSWLVQISDNKSALTDQYKSFLADSTEVTSVQIEESIALNTMRSATA